MTTFAKNELVINVPDIRAIYYKSQGDYVTALNSYQEVQSFYPSSSVPHFFKADLYYRLNDIEQTKNELQKAALKAELNEQTLENFKSKVGQYVEILDLEQFGKSLFIDNEIQVATSDEHLYSGTFVNAGLKLNKDKETAAIIGGGDGGVARECISKGFGYIDWFELDPEVVDVCEKHLGSIGNKSTRKNSVKCVWGDAFESIKKVEDDRYDKIFVDLNDDQFCIDLAAKNMDSLVRILKPNGVITAQVGSQDKKPKQVDKWLKVFNKNFGNATLDRVYIPSFDCSWNFSSSINH